MADDEVLRYKEGGAAVDDAITVEESSEEEEIDNNNNNNTDDDNNTTDEEEEKEGMNIEKKKTMKKARKKHRVTTPKYIKGKNAIEKKFFDTIRKFGGPTLVNKLLVRQLTNYNCYDKEHFEDYAFYNIVGGEVNDEKKDILYTCIILCRMKWYTKIGKSKGQAIKSNSFTTIISTLFSRFHEKGIQLQWNKHFNVKNNINEKDFDTKMIKKWINIRKKDPKFGVVSNETVQKIDKEEVGDEKFKNVIINNTLSPYTDAKHLQLVIVLILGRFYGIHNCLDMVSILRCNISHRILPSGDDNAGLYAIAINVKYITENGKYYPHPIAITYDDGWVEIIENPYNPACPVSLLLYYINKLHPKTERLLSKIATTEQKMTYKKSMKDHHDNSIWYCPGITGNTISVIGKNKLAELRKEIITICEYENWDQCTNQRHRKTMLLANNDDENDHNNKSEFDLTSSTSKHNKRKKKNTHSSNGPGSYMTIIMSQNTSTNNNNNNQTIQKAISYPNEIIMPAAFAQHNNKSYDIVFKNEREELEYLRSLLNKSKRPKNNINPAHSSNAMIPSQPPPPIVPQTAAAAAAPLPMVPRIQQPHTQIAVAKPPPPPTQIAAPPAAAIVPTAAPHYPFSTQQVPPSYSYNPYNQPNVHGCQTHNFQNQVTNITKANIQQASTSQVKQAQFLPTIHQPEENIMTASSAQKFKDEREELEYLRSLHKSKKKMKSKKLNNNNQQSSSRYHAQPPEMPRENMTKPESTLAANKRKSDDISTLSKNKEKEPEHLRHSINPNKSNIPNPVRYTMPPPPLPPVHLPSPLAPYYTSYHPYYQPNNIQHGWGYHQQLNGQQYTPVNPMYNPPSHQYHTVLNYENEEEESSSSDDD